MKEKIESIKRTEIEIKDFFGITSIVDIFFWKENIIFKNKAFYWTDGVGVYPITLTRDVISIYKKNEFTAILCHEYYHPCILYVTNDFREE